jgi:1,5-anhydro-D-fructose reductase (1,5-anhydro-D-mannitol-forming)
MIRIGIVGCGRILASHLRGYRLLREAGVDDFRITALCSLEEDEARMYLRRGQGPAQRAAVSEIPGDPLATGDEYLSDFQDDVEVEVYTDFGRMMVEAKIDAVNDFTTHALHHRVGAAAFDQGKHLLTQKPLAVTTLAAGRMCDEAEARGLTFGVFENARFRPATRHLRWLFDSGPGGRLQMVLLGNVGTWWAPNLIVAQTAWRHRRIEAGGIGLDMGVHQFDMIRHVVGEVANVQARTAIVEPVRVTLDGKGKIVERIDCDADDTFYASFQTRSGVTGTLVASWAGHGEPTTFGPGVTFYGSNCRVAGTTATFDEGPSVELADLYAEGCPEERKERDFPLGLDEQFALAQDAGLVAMRQGRRPETDGREALADLACAYALLESDAAGRRVKIEEVVDGSLADYQRPINEHYGIA